MLPHGAEWKNEYRRLFLPFLNEGVFPADVLSALKNYIANPAASGCTDMQLQRVLMRYDTSEEKIMLLEELPVGSIFRIRNGRVFTKGEQMRKRFRCKEYQSGLSYFVSPLTEVELVEG